MNTAGETRSTYRLRDLSRRDRWLAALGAVILVVPPVVAFVYFLPDWRPGGDNAFIGFRVLDVGTSRTPVLGQPSSSGHYGGEELNVRHLGALHYYYMAPFVRLLGTAAGMMLASVLVVSAGSLLTVWAVFRRLGRAAGAVAVVALSAVVFGIGAAGLLNPISSNFAVMPLFCSAVLAWAVLSGDLRLLPLAVVVLSLAVQQHLSVGPSVAVLLVTVVASWSVRWWRARRRDDRELQRQAQRWGLAALGLGFLVWLPLLVQEVAGAGRGNLSGLWTYVSDTDSDSGTLGLGYSVRQVGHVLDYPFLVTRTQLTGHDLLRPLAWSDWLFVVAVLALLALAAVRWGRAGDRRLSVVAIVGVLVVAGLLNGARVPEGWEQGRLVFYHWIWPLTFFLLMTAMLLARDGLRALAARGSWRHTARRVRGRLPAALTTGRLAGPAGAVSVVALVGLPLIGLPLVNTQLDRPTNELSRMSLTYPRRVYEDLTDQVIEHRDRIPEGDVLLMVKGEGFFEGTFQAIGLALEEEGGLSVRFPNRFWTFMDDSRLAWHRDDFDSILLVAVNSPETVADPRPGDRIASYHLWEDVDLDAHRTLLDQLEGADELVPGPELAELMEDPGVRALFDEQMEPDKVGRALTDPDAVQFMLDYSLAEPHLDRAALERLRDSLLEAEDSGTMGEAVNMEVYLVTDPEEMREATVWANLED